MSILKNIVLIPILFFAVFSLKVNASEIIPSIGWVEDYTFDIKDGYGWAESLKEKLIFHGKEISDDNRDLFLTMNWSICKTAILMENESIRECQIFLFGVKKDSVLLKYVITNSLKFKNENFLTEGFTYLTSEIIEINTGDYVIFPNPFRSPFLIGDGSPIRILVTNIDGINIGLKLTVLRPPRG